MAESINFIKMNNPQIKRISSLFFFSRMNIISCIFYVNLSDAIYFSFANYNKGDKLFGSCCLEFVRKQQMFVRTENSHTRVEIAYI